MVSVLFLPFLSLFESKIHNFNLLLSQNTYLIIIETLLYLLSYQQITDSLKLPLWNISKILDIAIQLFHQKIAYKIKFY